MGVEAIVMGVLAASAATLTGLAVSNAMKDPPGMQDLPPLPPNATDAEKQARTAATNARKAQQQAAGMADGRQSTILTGPGQTLGNPGTGPNAQPKQLLGM